MTMTEQGRGGGGGVTSSPTLVGALAPGVRLPGPGDAKRRALVSLADGRVARLSFVPPADGVRSRRSPGRKARVQLLSGGWLSVPVEGLRLVEGAELEALRAADAAAGVGGGGPGVVSACDVCQERQAFVTVGCVDYCARCALELGVSWR